MGINDNWAMYDIRNEEIKLPFTAAIFSGSFAGFEPSMRFGRRKFDLGACK